MQDLTKAEIARAMSLAPRPQNCFLSRAELRALQAAFYIISLMKKMKLLRLTILAFLVTLKVVLVVAARQQQAETTAWVTEEPEMNGKKNLENVAARK